MNLTDTIRQMSPLSLAYVGDAVFSLFVRNRLVLRYDHKPGELHKICNRYVKAVSQAQMLQAVLDDLLPEEQDVARRARNAHSGNKAKHAGLAAYKKATALESVIGYLYLSEQHGRLQEIMLKCALFAEQEELR